MSGTIPPSLSVIDSRAKEIVAAVRDDPEGRYRLRADFYRKYAGDAPGEFGYGNSEMAFLRWEISRGVLNPLDHPKRPGSQWWRGVNEQFIYIATLAALIHEAGVDGAEAPSPVRCWIEYVREPGARSWYRAHNAAILDGYLEHGADALHEDTAERAFVNVVLYRLLYAQSLVECARLGLGPASALVGLPCLPAVQIVVHLPRLYPSTYPIARSEAKRVSKLVSRRVCKAAERTGGILLEVPVPEDVRESIAGLSRIAILRNAVVFLLYYLCVRWVNELTLVGRLFENMVEYVMDRLLILPNLPKLYDLAGTEWLPDPRLKELLVDGVPVYPYKRVPAQKAKTATGG